MLTFVDINFSAIDQTALTIVAMGLIIVFSALITIYLVFRYILPFFLHITLRRKAERLGYTGDSVNINSVQGDVSAAIGMALYLHLNEIHDDESNVITIKRVSRTYSPWSSKLYSMKNLK